MDESNKEGKEKLQEIEQSFLRLEKKFYKLELELLSKLKKKNNEKEFTSLCEKLKINFIKWSLNTNFD